MSGYPESSTLEMFRGNLASGAIKYNSSIPPSM